ncbi:hypothetical protein GF357_02090 [Candidatus Dojkabacteria bacterium]|nr:hypothetical protein [Candidatus Dojkabacteria bacterium]
MSEENAQQKPNMLTPGKVLGHYREKRGFSLEQISEATKIPIDQLKAIEEDNYGDEDTQVFLRGFIKNYSDYLKLDTDKILAIYRRTLATQSEPDRKPLQKTKKKRQPAPSPATSSDSEASTIQARPAPQKSTKRKTAKKNFSITPQKIITALVGILIIVVITYIAIQYNKFKQPPQLEITSPENNVTVEADTTEVVGKTDPGSVVEINGETIQTDSEGNFQVKVKLAQGSNAIIIKAYKNNNEDRSTVATRTVMYQIPEPQEEDQPDEENPDESSANETAEDTAKELAVTLTIEGEATWIKLVTDDQQLIGNDVSPGEIGPYPFKESLEIVSGKPKNTLIQVGEQEVELVANPETGVARAYCIVDTGELNCQ